MSFDGQTVVIVGATGTVGSGVVRKYLDAGARVVGVSRSQDKLGQLAETLKIAKGEPFVPVVASFDSEVAATAAKEAIVGAIAGKPLHHVVSAQGFVTVAKAPTETPLATVEEAFRDGLFNNFLAAKALLPLIAGREGASFTLVSGGFAHFPPPNPAFWLGTVKNAAVNGFTYALAAETAKSKARANTICIHLSIAPVGGKVNQFGMEAAGDTLRLAPAFLGLAKSQRRGEVICVGDWKVAEDLAAS
jgi:NAD(P)-dependent dehydrogenase (short-subunit alcohol dehydrogenase family)